MEGDKMRKIEILDCTLRDGGYVNHNDFGHKNIKEIVDKLEQSHIDFIECGYLMDDQDVYSKDITEYRSMDELESQNIINTASKSEFTLMMLGEKYDITNLPESRSTKNNIIRMSFHKHMLSKAVEYAKIITRKGYRLFLQPTVTIGYQNDEIIAMIKAINNIDLYGIAIVDTFGQMLPNDVIRLTKIFDKHLRPDIKLAFHAHNNLQMAFANAIVFIENSSEQRDIVIDSSLYGMGRGAGNLPTELLANYLNENYSGQYAIDNLLEVSDNIIEKIYHKNPWGYSLAYYLSAKYACHPNYVLYLLGKKMLNSNDINQVLKLISTDKLTEYDKNYIEELYIAYNEKNVDDSYSYKNIERFLKGREVLLIGPGKSLAKYHDKIAEYASDHNCYTITINNPKLLEHDAVFYSNKKRYEENKLHKEEPLEIITSNISLQKEDNRIIFDYTNSLSRKVQISDSALLMLLTILEKTGISNVTLAGFDGYNTDQENYYDDSIAYMLDNNYIKELNDTMRKNIQAYQQSMNIKTITPSKNIKEEIR